MEQGNVVSAKDFNERGILRELARLFSGIDAARSLLTAAGLPPGDQPPPPSGEEAFWLEACLRVELRNKPLQDLLVEAVARVPDNEILNGAIRDYVGIERFEASVSFPNARVTGMPMR